MSDPSLLIICLAAGKGTRMKSRKPKVMHAIAGYPMLGHVLSVATDAGADELALVVSPDMSENIPEMTEFHALMESQFENATQFVQPRQLGTGDAVKAARTALEGFEGEVVVLFGDTPLLKSSTIRSLRACLREKASIAVLGFNAKNPSGYGRLLIDEGGSLIAIREEKDASLDEKSVTLCNSGVFAFRSETLLSVLDKINNQNANGEYYLTDAIEIARRDSLPVQTITAEEQEVLGINTRAQLANAEAIWQNEKRRSAMANGATLVAPETVYFSYDTQIGRDVLIEPHVIFATGVRVGDGAVIRSFSHLEKAVIDQDCIVGPFARLRPGADLGRGVRIGNFVEVKESRLEEGAKVNHLTYIGDTHVGARANIGAGTITCNYDGYSKHRTIIGDGAFIGSNSSLVAPVTIGNGAYVGSGTVVTKDVKPDSLVVTRGPLTEKEDWAAKFRNRAGRK